MSNSKKIIDKINAKNKINIKVDILTFVGAIVLVGLFLYLYPQNG